jgi:uncharacterized protein (UPF0332 family)
VSPRSAEFLEAAGRRLAHPPGADDDAAGAISAAYYAMLYAARAALSERDTYAKTHAGTWYEFREAFVATGLFDSDLAADAQRVQPAREQADYEAWRAPEAEARRIVELAGSFVAAVRALVGDDHSAVRR